MTELIAFEVEVDGYSSVTILAETPRKARYRAFVAFRDAFGHSHTFHSFLTRGVRVSKAVTY